MAKGNKTPSVKQVRQTTVAQKGKDEFKRDKVGSPRGKAPKKRTKKPA